MKPRHVISLLELLVDIAPNLFDVFTALNRYAEAVQLRIAHLQLQCA